MTQGCTSCEQLVPAICQKPQVGADALYDDSGVQQGDQFEADPISGGGDSTAEVLSVPVLPGAIPASDSDLTFEPYRILDSLGKGGWCTVMRVQDTRTGKQYALKTFHAQALRQTDAAAIAKRFEAEIAIFKELGLSYSHLQESDPIIRSLSGSHRLSPRDLFVNLIDYSHVGTDDLTPSRSTDGRFYTVLELAEVSLETWLEHRASERSFITLAEVQEFTRSLASGLFWMHSMSLCHLDLKPANLLRFGDRWKIIDLEGAVHLAQPAGQDFRLDCVTPLYASPELARAVMRSQEVVDGSTSIVPGLSPSKAMDLWAAGVVLLDVLAHECVFQETWSGFQAQYLMDGCGFDEAGLGFQKEWYEFLADQTPVAAKDYVTSPATSVSMLSESAELQRLLSELLTKEPENRLSSEDFVKHPFVALACMQQDSQELDIQVLDSPPSGSLRAADTAPAEAAAGGFAQRWCRRLCEYGGGRNGRKRKREG